MSLPTLQETTVNSISSALTIFYAVYLGVLKKADRRLDVDERESLKSGDVYVWEERDFQSEVSEGIERWTDGIKWGSSREFLFYYERDYDSKEAQSVQDARLIKQTYSVFVQTPGDPRNRTRKWHMVAYYSQSTVEGLQRVENVPQLADLQVPDGLFRAARVKRGQTRAHGCSDPPSPTTGPTLRRSTSAVEAGSPLAKSRSPPRRRSRATSIGQHTTSSYATPYLHPSSGNRSVATNENRAPSFHTYIPTQVADYHPERETHPTQPELSPQPRLSELDISNAATLYPATPPLIHHPGGYNEFSRVLPLPNISHGTVLRGPTDHKALSALQKQFMK